MVDQSSLLLKRSTIQAPGTGNGVSPGDLENGAGIRMRLSAESLRRGLLKWNTESEVSIFTATSDEADEAVEWAGPCTDPNGSQVASEAKRLQHIRVVAPDQESAASPFPIRWERIEST